jgi:hypothetical protein
LARVSTWAQGWQTAIRARKVRRPRAAWAVMVVCPVCVGGVTQIRTKKVASS